MQLFNKYKHDLFLEILKVLNINSIDQLLTKKIRADVLKDPNILKQFNDMIADIKIFYSSDKLTCLHTNSIDKQKNPGVNFIRQILKVHGYSLKSISIYKGLYQNKRVYSRYYYVVPKSQKMKRSNSNPNIFNQNNGNDPTLPNSVPNTNNFLKVDNNTTDLTSSFISDIKTDELDATDLQDLHSNNSSDDRFDPYSSFDFE